MDAARLNQVKSQKPTRSLQEEEKPVAQPQGGYANASQLKQAAQQIANVSNRNISVDLTRLTNSVMNSWRADYKDEMGSLINEQRNYF